MLYARFIKRIFDILFSIVALCVLWPVYIVIAILIKIKLGNPVLFSQQRPGLNEKPFYMYKFRTMTEKRDTDGELLPDEQRITNFGFFLRSTSLDELPELFNVFKGEMSFVGPRPLLMEYLKLYSKEQARRHEVRPGITGWAQINGRNELSWQNKFKMDVWYVDHLTFLLDLKIILLTFFKIFKREGINQTGQATVQYFKGNHNESV